MLWVRLESNYATIAAALSWQQWKQRRVTVDRTRVDAGGEVKEATNPRVASTRKCPQERGQVTRSLLPILKPSVAVLTNASQPAHRRVGQPGLGRRHCGCAAVVRENGSSGKSGTRIGCAVKHTTMSSVNARASARHSQKETNAKPRRSKYRVHTIEITPGYRVTIHTRGEELAALVVELAQQRVVPVAERHGG